MIVTGELLEALEQLDPAARNAFIKIVKNLEKAIGETVRKEDFNELGKKVADLAEAQKETEKSLKELAEAQKRTEQRIEELVEVQKKSEQRVDKLEQAVQELVEAQKRTEQRVEELAEAQKKTEEEIQKLTMKLDNLIEDHKRTREQIGSLSHAFGYYLENEAYKHLPRLLQSKYSLVVEGDLIRTYLETRPNAYEEVTIYGYGRKDGERYLILGECKSQLKKGDIDKFLKKVERLKRFYDGKPFVIFVTHQPTFEALKYIQKLELPLFYSYQFS
ncbi:MAG: chordopoxvirus fusion protein [Acidobacteria bacterium]|jgi:vacuolar-type H+-ATPase subunit I/STV1|nr:MAG: chordopoxvirus fusion protein [Acidobacteriota bacterium]GIU81908.1 MAG: hypothetical protein KatS3mg006_0972 [Pyrinomonadaceae bacterium]